MCNVYIIENRDKVNEIIARLDETYRETGVLNGSKNDRKELCDFWDALFGGTKFEELGVDDGNLSIVSDSLIRCYKPLVNNYTLAIDYCTDGHIEFTMNKYSPEKDGVLEDRAFINDISKITEEILNDIFDNFTKVAEEDNILAIESSDDGLVRVVTDYNHIL